MKTIRRILKIHKIEGFKVFCLFNTGESRIIDFKDIFEKWKIDEEDPEFLLLNDEKAFKKVKLIEGTLVWENIKIQGIDEKGQKVEYPFDMDPIVLYENSILDETRQLELGLLIKKSRTELGLTQEELAKRSGTTKHYISRVENDKTGIELSTLKKIIEGGLGKRMKISII